MTFPERNFNEFAGKVIITVVGAVGVVALAAVMLALPVYWLWNWIMPTVFMLPSVTLWQALGIMLLTGLLFRTSHGSSK